ncbi:hypothetical protein MtrunA17_Chr8g0379691 [Medicago truncatula]|uniref:Uncharacterized protein n=1 Tax=Medicago truncatula TaxID=3880 RepID=A0A396GNI6_MEDTR|nr:hypothetical protein MtrunA17_Chr8g0379691 [Medicago truncatula]
MNFPAERNLENDTRTTNEARLKEISMLINIDKTSNANTTILLNRDSVHPRNNSQNQFQKQEYEVA